MSLIYYVYAYLTDSGIPYYIGKGKNKRAWIKSKNEKITIPKNKSKIVFLEKNLTEVGSLAIERRMIKWYGRVDNGTGILQNKTDGGQGHSGKICSDETRLKMSMSAKGRKLSEETKQKMRKPKSEETRQKMRQPKSEKSKQNLRKPRSEEFKSKLRNPRSEETRRKISIAQLGIPKKPYGPMSEERKEKLRKPKSKSGPRKPMSEETKRKISLTKSRKKESYINEG